METRQFYKVGIFANIADKLFACPRVYKDPMKEATEYIEQESEYDTESESEMPATVDSDQEDEMTFLRALTTRSSSSVQAFLASGTVVLGAVKITERLR